MTLSTTARIVQMVPCFINYKAFPCFFLLYTAAIRIKPLLQPIVVIDRTFNLSLQQCLQIKSLTERLTLVCNNVYKVFDRTFNLSLQQCLQSLKYKNGPISLV